MKQKLLVAPLLSLTLLLIFSYPLQKSDLKTKISPRTNSLVISGGTAYRLQTSTLSLRKGLSIIEHPVNSQKALLPAEEWMSDPAIEATLELEQFIAQVGNGQTGNILRGVHVAGTLALEVEQQPHGNSTFVSSRMGAATQFKSAAENGVVGLLAHNYLSGALFYDLKLGQEVHLVYGEGQIENYRVSEIERFQKLNPASLSGDLVEVSTGRRFTTNQVFNRFYTGGDHVTFQTCLASGGLSNWGLVFIVAKPVH
jgi:hypothetical protein